MQLIVDLREELVNNLELYSIVLKDAQNELRDTLKFVKDDAEVIQSKLAFEQLYTESPNLKATAVAIRHSNLTAEPLEQVFKQCTDLANKLQVQAAVFDTIMKTWPDSDMHTRFSYAICDAYTAFLKCIEVCDEVMSGLSMLCANASPPVS